MENCTLYSHQTDFERIVEIVKNKLPHAQIDYQDAGRSKSLQLIIKGGLFKRKRGLTINYRERSNPSYTLEKVECELTQNLSGMVNFIASIPLHNRSLATQLRYKVKSVNSEIAFMAEPNIGDVFMPVLRNIADELDAIAFVQPSTTFNLSTHQHFLDSALRLLTDVAGQSSIDHLDVKVDTQYFDPPNDSFTQEQLDRRHESEKVLLKHGVNVNWHLPCLPSLEQSKWRSVAEIVDRIYALLIIAALGEGVEKTQLDRVIQEKNIQSFSPWEQELLKKSTLTDQEKALSTWRYESLFVLLWAIGKCPDLHFPDKICDVPAMVDLLMASTRGAFEAEAVLRDKASLLAARDLSYRMNWACVDARVKAEELTGGINPSIIYERHYALNWLNCYQDAEWDKVSTDT